uniref:Uncharacterized protein n=1 Tax=Cacopsylla melanoneura TaxID=428564 RepID=A0A8D8Z449_9HEMI
MYSGSSGSLSEFSLVFAKRTFLFLGFSFFVAFTFFNFNSSITGVSVAIMLLPFFLFFLLLSPATSCCGYFLTSAGEMVKLELLDCPSTAGVLGAGLDEGS